MLSLYTCTRCRKTGTYIMSTPPCALKALRLKRGHHLNKCKDLVSKLITKIGIDASALWKNVLIREGISWSRSSRWLLLIKRESRSRFFIKVYGAAVFGEGIVRACAAMWSPTWLALPSHLPSRLDRFCCKLDGLCHVYFAFRCKSIWMKI